MPVATQNIYFHFILIQANGTSNALPAPKRILFSRDDIQIGWKSSGRRWLVGSGMTNVGNTCYLNSTLQAIFHVPSMANWLMSDTKHRETCENNGKRKNKNNPKQYNLINFCFLGGGQGGCIICAMAKTLISSQGTQSAIKPWLVYSKLRLVCKHLTLGRQEDAHEFLRYLIESMEKLYLGRFKNSKDLEQYSKETTPLNQILGGYLRSAVRCLSCNHVSTTYQHFQDLLLDIRKANSVEEALEGYFARERLEDMGYKCEACKKRVSATKQFSLERAPIALCIQLKRFSMMGSKLNKHVQIRQRLDLSAYASQSLKKTGDKLNYRLVSMVTHLGSSQNCGHYTAIGLAESGSYHQFDDSYVRSIPIQNVMNTNAYIIFYELDDVNVRSANSSSTMTSSSVFLNENTNGFNGK
jgi:ubiquitin carboxyl-terminal hydrolase 36/42